MTTTEPQFTHLSVGCHIDGSGGIDHARRRLVELANFVKAEQPADVRECVDALENDGLSDDHCEFDVVTEWLQQHTADGLVWDWSAGDLVLFDRDNAD